TETAAELASVEKISFGPYRLLQRLGEGGMGEVWLAEQSKPVRRRVALKLIKAGMDTREVVARFESERQALALPDHPAIAKVSEVDGKPMPRIIDFGLAKATSQRLTDGSMYTRVGTIMGTLEYMSPEQADSAGEDIDTRTDVYSLGVVLYQLLVGALPLDLKK